MLVFISIEQMNVGAGIQGKSNKMARLFTVFPDFTHYFECPGFQENVGRLRGHHEGMQRQASLSTRVINDSTSPFSRILSISPVFETAVRNLAFAKG